MWMLPHLPRQYISRSFLQMNKHHCYQHQNSYLAALDLSNNATTSNPSNIHCQHVRYRTKVKEHHMSCWQTMHNISTTTTTVLPAAATLSCNQEYRNTFTNNYKQGHHHQTNSSSSSQNDHTWIPSDTWIQDCVARETNNSANYKKKFKPQWPYYRLGDCLKACAFCEWSLKTSRVKNQEQTIVGQYWKHVCLGHQDGEDRRRMTNSTSSESAQRTTMMFNVTFMSHLFATLERMNPRHVYGRPAPPAASVLWRKPASDELVIHLRIGDVVDEPRYSNNASVYEMLRYGSNTRHGPHTFYDKGIKSVEEYLSTIRESGLEKIVIRGGSHFPKVYPKSRIYTACITQAIQKAGYTITNVHIDGEDNADQDFFYMSHAKHFIQATGGYSRLIAEMVKHYAGRIVGRVPINSFFAKRRDNQREHE